jgi:hypothetical protein
VGHVHNFSNLVPHYVCVDAAEECVPEPCGSGGWTCLAPLAQPQPGGSEFSAVRPRRLQRLGLWSRWHALEPHCLQRPARAVKPAASACVYGAPPALCSCHGETRKPVTAGASSHGGRTQLA